MKRPLDFGRFFIVFTGLFLLFMASHIMLRALNSMCKRIAYI